LGEVQDGSDDPDGEKAATARSIEFSLQRCIPRKNAKVQTTEADSEYDSIR